MGCAIGTVRYILFFFNFLLALAGLGILILGVLIAQDDGATISTAIKGQLSTPAILFSVIGGCIFLFAFFGCCGALRESHCMIVTYAVLLLTLLLLQVAVAVLAYNYRGSADEIIEESLRELYDEYKSPNGTQKIVDSMQQQLHCCGSTSNGEPWNTKGWEVPPSCFDQSNEKYHDACIPAAESFVEDKLSRITHAAIVLAVVEVIGIIFALCLGNSIRRSELRGYA